MSVGGLIFVIAAVVVVAAVLAWFLLQRRHPEAVSHLSPERHGSAKYHSDVGRPAGPGAEADGVAGRGQPIPGPSAEFSDRDV